ncbi:hypothetical protein [Streptomyces sp. NRRL F-5650]|uniref:hypothetical protein n=1 Tax=Streptomyces sp. NRRL F-5650 TaxID=1463868 RepID=UPI002D21E45D|nr:hypothetical protein [Streptomyces sp. NRRL F-5650]
MAVSALTGCTTVGGRAVDGPSGAGARSSAPRPDGPAEPRVVQAPAREALEMIGPSPTTKGATAKPHPAGTPAPRSTPHAPPATHAAGRQDAPPPAPGPTRAPAAPRPGAPGVPGTPGSGGKADVCSLGKQYGGWRPGSPEARICEQAYGH